jgi:hypothetical protein
MRIAGCISIASALALAAACGSGSNANTSPGNDAGSAVQGEGGSPVGSHDGASGVPGSDAASDAADYGPYPATHYPLPLMKNFGGAVLSAPKIVTVTFVGDANRDAERTFDDGVVQGDWWTTVTNGWSIGKGTGGVYAELPTTDVANKTLDDTDLQPLIAKWISTGALPPPDANTVYAIYFPTTTTLTLQGSTGCTAGGWGGYHNEASMLLAGDGGASVVDGGGVDVAYAVLPNCSGNGASTVTVSHELIEAATDPHPSDKPGWYGYQDAWWGAGGGEVGDACESRKSVTWNGNHVTRAWVNTAAAASHDPCQPALAGEVFYSAAVPTEVVKGIHDPTGGPDYDSDGYMIMQRGQSKTVDVVVFSEAALPHDVQLLVGVPAANNPTNDPTLVDPITGGVTATLTPTTGHNGTHVTLKVDVAQNATAGDYPFFVRAILDAAGSDYHSWWVVLRVQ